MGSVPDRTAFDRLVVEHIPAMLALATKLTGSAEAAEDVVQDALVKAARGAGTFRGESSIKTWLWRIVVNAFRDRVARRGEEGLGAEVVDRRGRGPVEEAMAGEFEAAVGRAVSGLPGRQREVLVLHAYERMGTGEIAGVLGCSEAAVRKNLQLARERLRPVVEGYGGRRGKGEGRGQRSEVGR